MKLPTTAILSAALSLSAVSCGTTDATLSEQKLVMKRENEAGAAVLPRVITPGWHAQGDGKPMLDLNGYNRVGYVKDGSPKDVVEVFYHGQDNPRVNTDDQEFVTIMGQKVQTYGSGNEIVAFATQPMRLTAPNGTSAYYSFEFNNEHLYKSRQIPAFGW